MARLASEAFSHRHAFIFGFVRQHRAVDHVANGINALDIGTPMTVSHDLPAIRGGNSHFLKSEPFGKRLPASGQQHDLSLKTTLFVILAERVVHGGYAIFGFDT